MENNTYKLLIADDDKDIRSILSLILTQEGYEVLTAQNGQEVLELADESIDLYILDVGMPVLSGFAAARQLSGRFSAPVIFLTAYSTEADKVMGFSAGADDYIVKPFSNTELLLRVRAVLRRTHRLAPAESSLKENTAPSALAFKDLTLDLDSQSVKRGDEMILLTYTEFQLLRLFITHPKKIFSPENLYQSIWGETAVGDAAIMVHIKNLRKKLGDSSRSPRYIKTAWGKGYYLE